MAAKKKRVDRSTDHSPLTASPFAALDALKNQLPTESVSTSSPPLAEILDTATTAYSVARTRKGGWPVSFEKRGSGKLVTIIDRISGDGNVLLKALRKHCATGGALKDDVIELQGDQRNKVGAFLDKTFQK